MSYRISRQQRQILKHLAKRREWLKIIADVAGWVAVEDLVEAGGFGINHGRDEPPYREGEAFLVAARSARRSARALAAQGLVELEPRVFQWDVGEERVPNVGTVHILARSDLSYSVHEAPCGRPGQHRRRGVKITPAGRAAIEREARTPTLDAQAAAAELLAERFRA